MNVILRSLRREDCKLINQAFLEQGWDKPFSQYEYYLELQEEGRREIIVAEIEDEFAGYLTIQWKSDYPPFREKGIPEIMDFNVLKKFQRLGIGTKLMDEAEERIHFVSSNAGIGFGIMKDYGPAQILYVKRGYVPDGNGVVKDYNSIKYGDSLKMDDSLTLYLVKPL